MASETSISISEKHLSIITMSSSKVVSTVGVVLGGLLQVCRADKPIIQTNYSADPAPLVYNHTVWLFANHDEDG